MSLKDHGGRLARWSMKLQPFDFTIKSVKGSDNVVADTLSRAVEELEPEEDWLLGFETTEFESEEYVELRRDHRFTSGSDYQLARKLQALEDSELKMLTRGARVEWLRDTMRENLHKAHETSARSFNRNTREVKFEPGQEVFRRNFVLSDFGKSINAKFARKFVKCRIRRPIGNSMYEVEDLKGKGAGVFHVKDLKQ
ncbi:hypothetical protein KR018_006796 [Drosophila ironensis]|nr:hypothetical protein KR018_006796 [Drosophila ironensis]